MSNTSSAREQWEELANSIGFIVEDVLGVERNRQVSPSEEAMWQQLYGEENRSISDLAKHLGFGTATIQRRLGIADVKMRKRGGRNMPSRVYEKLFHLDQRFLALAHPEEIAKICACSIHTVYRVKRVQ